MSDVTFHQLKVLISKQFKKMAKGKLYASNASKDQLWDTYLGSFEEGTNPIYLERTEHDCNCCKQFIRAAGNVLSIVDGKLVSIWDVKVGAPYDTVVAAMSKLTIEAGIHSIFLHSEASVGTDRSNGLDKDGKATKWLHFHQDLPAAVVRLDGGIGAEKGKSRTNYNVFKRSVTEISFSAIDIVKDLIGANSLYRGEEMLDKVLLIEKAKKAYEKEADRELALWDKMSSFPNGYDFNLRGTSIGQLLVAISDGDDLEVAVGKYEAMVAPENYKRSSAVATPGMIKKAQETLASIAGVSVLKRRHANIRDITINNVMFADRTAAAEMDVFGELAQEAPKKAPKLDRVTEVTIDDFLANVLPTAESLEVMVENNHESNLVSLVAPVDPEAGNILKWGNNFTHSYNGELADSSMRDNVKAAGGKVDGFMRFSIQWNEEGQDNTDLDAHAHAPGAHVYFSNRGGRGGPQLDVDITSPGRKTAVENITYAQKTCIKPGRHKFSVKDFSGHGTVRGFRAEFEFDGDIMSFDVPKLDRGKTLTVLTIDVKKTTGGEISYTIVDQVSSTSTPKTIWGVRTKEFQKVSVIMNSPNFWDEQSIGNRHVFFMLDGCQNPDPVRGFYNEFLSHELAPHRKVFELLSNKMKAPFAEEQLSGIGFSSTQRNELVVKVNGSMSRLVKIKF